MLCNHLDLIFRDTGQVQIIVAQLRKQIKRSRLNRSPGSSSGIPGG
jgi:hypothetical protein